ncbi:DUF4136 domain-containing protein [Campylobacterota bacterium]
MSRYILPVLLLLMLGCSSKHPNIDYDPSFSIASLKTYEVIHTNTPVENSLNSDRIRKAIIGEMQMKGYEHTTKDIADFHITFESLIEEDVPSNFSFGFGFGTFTKNTGTSIATSHNPSNDQGNLLINMIDPKTNKTFWKSSFMKKIHDFNSPQERTEYFNRVIYTMLKEFPKQIEVDKTE